MGIEKLLKNPEKRLYLRDVIIQLIEPYATIRGKISRSDDLVFRVRYGHQEVYHLRHPYTGPRTIKQQRVMAHFGLVSKLVKLALATNRSYWETQFAHAPKRFKTLRGFVFSTLFHSI